MRIDPERVFAILELRAYVKAKRAYEQIDKLPVGERAAVMEDPVVEIVKETEFALAREELDAQRKGTVD